jgi:hypothetical protein
MLAAALAMAPRHRRGCTLGDKSHRAAKTPALNLVAHLALPFLRPPAFHSGLPSWNSRTLKPFTPKGSVASLSRLPYADIIRDARAHDPAEFADGEHLHTVAVRGEPQFVEWLRQHSSVRPIPGSAANLMRGERLVHMADRREEDAYSGDPVFRGLWLAAEDQIPT